ncbi:MAG: hypothetical protein U0Q16_32865 [Bryobacteraceae bacterium]
MLTKVESLYFSRPDYPELDAGSDVGSLSACAGQLGNPVLTHYDGDKSEGGRAISRTVTHVRLEQTSKAAMGRPALR